MPKTRKGVVPSLSVVVGPGAFCRVLTWYGVVQDGVRR